MAYCTTDSHVSGGSAMRVNREKSPIFGLGEIARYAGVSENTIRKLVKNERFPAGKIGGQWSSDAESIDRWRALRIGNQ